MKKINFLLISIIIVSSFLSSTVHAENVRPDIKIINTPDPDTLFWKKCEDLSEKYSGPHEIILINGIILRPDKVAHTENTGSILLCFEEDPKAPDNFEEVVIIPLTETSSINGVIVDQADANYLVGNDSLTIGENIVRAIKFYEKALEINPQHKGALINLGRSYVSLGKANEAISLTKNALEIYPNSEDLHLNLGDAYTILNKIPEAIECYKKVISINPDRASAYNNLGVLYLKSRKQKEAKKYLLKAKGLFIKADNSKQVNLIDSILNELE